MKVTVNQMATTSTSTCSATANQKPDIKNNWGAAYSCHRDGIFVARNTVCLIPSIGYKTHIY